MVEAPGADYQYIGINLRDPRLQDVRVRQALAYAIDRQAIVEYLRRGLADAGRPACCRRCPGHSTPDIVTFLTIRRRRATLLDEAGYRDPDGDGPRRGCTLTLKVSNIEFNRLQSSVIQQNLRDVGIALDVRTYEFATLYADVLAGNFQLYFLQWAGGALADPDILRRVFHSTQVPPAGFNRGHFSNPQRRRAARRGGRLDRPRRSGGGCTRRSSGSLARRGALHQPVVQDERRRRAAHRSTGLHLLADRRFHVSCKMLRARADTARG